MPTKKKLKMAELQFLRADRADIDAYRTQPKVYKLCIWLNPSLYDLKD
jgi:hypothetical protein